MRKIVELKQAYCTLSGKRVLGPLNWLWKQGESWAVLGGNGAGKSSLMRLVRGDIWTDKHDGQRYYHCLEPVVSSPIGFKETTASVSMETWQRYRRMNWSFSGLDVVMSGIGGGVYLQEGPTCGQVEAARALMDKAGCSHLAERPLPLMSQGQAMLSLMLRAVMAGPDYLFLDECYEGLDTATLGRMKELCQEMLCRGVHVMQAAHRRSEILPGINRVLRLENGLIQVTGGRELLEEPGRVGQARSHRIPGRVGACLMEIENADVFWDENKVLHGIKWRIHQGEQWAVVGPNGSGKSTLLKLLAAERHCGLTGKILRFGEEHSNLWELRKRVGMVSASLQAAHKRPMTGLNLVLGGCFGSVGLHRRALPEHREMAFAALDRVGCRDIAALNTSQISYGMMRRLMLARALATRPELLLLDEPLAGLDDASRWDIRRIFEQLAKEGVTLIVVTHHPEELPGCISHLLRLERGGVVESGPWRRVI